jgi:hypothetical protein
MRLWSRWMTGSLAAGFTMFLVGTAFHLTVPIVVSDVPPQFLNANLFRPWGGWTSTYMALHPFVYGFVFAVVFLGLRRWTAFPPGIRGGLLYGAGVFAVGSLPIYLLAFASFQVSREIVLGWVLQSLAQYALAGMVLAYVTDDGRGTGSSSGMPDGRRMP